MSRYIFSHDEGLKQLLKIKFYGCYVRTPYAKRIIKLIIQSFPQRLTQSELAIELNISVKWLQHECKKAFNITYTQFTRIIRIYYALKLICETNLAFNEIAFELNYTEGSNMLRDFRKVLNISPDEAKKRLLTLTPIQLLCNN